MNKIIFSKKNFPSIHRITSKKNNKNISTNNHITPTKNHSTPTKNNSIYNKYSAPLTTNTLRAISQSKKPTKINNSKPFNETNSPQFYNQLSPDSTIKLSTPTKKSRMKRLPWVPHRSPLVIIWLLMGIIFQKCSPLILTVMIVEIQTKEEKLVSPRKRVIRNRFLWKILSQVKVWKII